LIFNHQHTGNVLSLSFDLSLNQSYFEAKDYTFLKDLFKQVTTIQNNTIVALKKE